MTVAKGKSAASTVIQLVVVGAIGIGAYWAWQNRESLPFIGGAAEQAAAPARPPTPVDVALAREGSVVVTLEALGTARSNEAVTVMSDVMGIVSEVRFDEGTRVKAGEVLVRFDSTIASAEVAVRQAEIEVRHAQLENARQLYDRAKQLMATQNVPAARFDELAAQLKGAEAEVASAEARLQAARAALAKRQVQAPFAGRLGIRKISVGALVEPGDAIITLDDISVIKLDFQIPERNLSYIAPGQEITAHTDAYPDRVYFGQVSSVDSRVDPVTRAVAVRALIDNPDESLKPGMFLLVELGVETRNHAVIIPEEAVVADGTARFVFVVAGDTVKQVPVDLGQRMPGEVEVLTGVEAGQKVVVGGVQKVRDGAAVAVREQATEAANAE